MSALELVPTDRLAQKCSSGGRFSPACRARSCARGQSDTSNSARHLGLQSRLVPDRFVEVDDVVAGLRKTELRWVDSGEIAREFESAAVFWFSGRKIVRWQPFETLTPP